MVAPSVLLLLLLLLGAEAFGCAIAEALLTGLAEHVSWYAYG
jgi:hypothetical protein